MRLGLPFVLSLATLTACGQTASEIGVPPRLSPVGSGYAASERSVHTYPQMPSPPVRQFSLWNDRQSKLFTDPRALAVGDILTVNIRINDRAKFVNESERERKSTKSFDIGGAFEAEGVGSSGSANFDIGSGTMSKGNGATARSEAINMSVAAVVTDVLPNGNLLISGSQEVRVNSELRVLTIAGIARPGDIGANNTISYERIAEARVSYGGRGRLTEVQQPPYGQQILDMVLPF